MKKILHLLSQRPLLTGSGITLDAFVRHANRSGWEQHVVVGVPKGDEHLAIGGLDEDRTHPLFFGDAPLDFDVPGMSDVMPYPSTVFSTMSEKQLSAYQKAWHDHLTGVIEQCRPDVIHSHHIWMMSSLVKGIAPAIPVVNHCHATGFRQMDLSPNLRQSVIEGCKRNDRFAVLHTGHAKEIKKRLGIDENQIHVVGAGFRDDLFHPVGRKEKPGKELLYVGKLSHAKGLAGLLDAWSRLLQKDPTIMLHIAGTGTGKEAKEYEQRIAHTPNVKFHGQISQQALGDLMRQSDVCVLPSFYEGVPLVLVEAFACGCRLVSTALPGVKEQLAPHLKEALDLVPLPRLKGPDTPMQEDIPVFVDNLQNTIQSSLEKDPVNVKEERFQATLKPFTWQAVFKRVEGLYLSLT